jgi:hypothetical protein
LTLKETQYVQNVKNVSETDIGGLNSSDSRVASDDQKWYCELDDIDAQIIGETFVKVQGLGDFLFENDTVTPGESTLWAPDAWIENGEIIVPNGEQGCQAEIEPLPTEVNGRRLTSGSKTVLVVRIEARDSETSANELNLFNEVFLGNSLTKMYHDCSHGELNFIPYTGNGVARGVTTVTISNTVKGASNDIIRNAAVNALNNKLGGQAENLVDFVMMCIPPGTTGGW